MNKALIVVDMQRNFIASKFVLDSVKDLVLAAVADKMPVIFVEYEGEGNTRGRLKNLVPKHMQITVTKDEDDGADVIVPVIKEKGWPSNLRVCGVNLSFCVGDTAISLKTGWKHKVTVVRNACANHPDDEEYIEGTLHQFRKFGVKVA